MIRINLLPLELDAAAPAQINPVIPLAFAAVIPALILTPIQLNQISTQKRLRTETASLKSDLDRYQPIIAQVEALEGAKVQLTQRKSVIQQLESERLRYPQFFDDFIKLLPGNLWLSNLVTSGQGGAGPMTVSMDVIALDAYAVADLIANLETSQIFSDVDLGAISVAQSPAGQTLSFHVNTSYRKGAILSDANKKS